jgi:hypothetical protein
MMKRCTCREAAKEEWDFLDDNSALIPEDFFVD